MTFDRVIITGPIVEYRRSLGPGILVIRIMVGDDPALSACLETLTPRFSISPYSMTLSEMTDMMTDARNRLTNQPLSISTFHDTPQEKEQKQ